jgi:hypothetical protein
MFLTSHRGCGKSYLAASADRPENILFVDFELKGQGIDSQLNFGKYLSITSMTATEKGFDYKPLDTWAVFKRELIKVEKGKYTVAILDNIDPLEAAMLAEAKKFPTMYNINPQNAITGAFGGAWPAVASLVSGVVNHLFGKGIRLVIATAHLKSPWAGGAPVLNAWRPKGIERWHELSILSLVLTKGENSPQPSALVMKEQLATATFNEKTQEVEIQRRLPLRIPRCTFAEIRRYLREPADLANPAKGETPDAEEAASYSDKFSRDQLFAIQLAQEVRLKGEEVVTEGEAEAPTK